MDNTQQLLKLIKDNPTLPVMPMVGEEVVADDSAGYWLGSFGRCEVNEYYIGRDRVHFKDEDMDEVLEDMAGCNYGETSDGRDIWDLSEEEWKVMFDELPWAKAIIVYIDSPDIWEE